MQLSSPELLMQYFGSQSVKGISEARYQNEKIDKCPAAPKTHILGSSIRTPQARNCLDGNSNATLGCD